MDISINYLGVMLAAASSMAIGAVYYAPGVYGKLWVKLAKVDETLYQKEIPKLMPLMLLGALVTAYVIARFAFLEHAFFHGSWLSASVAVALWLWAGIALITMVVHNALDQRPFKLTLINLGNRFLTFLAMGLILGWLHP